MTKKTMEILVMILKTLSSSAAVVKMLSGKMKRRKAVQLESAKMSLMRTLVVISSYSKWSYTARSKKLF